MNRKIKFRYWEHNKKLMITQEYRSNYEVLKEAMDHGYDLMEFTGLVDVNGREIWEGDLIVYANRKSKPRAVEYWSNGFYEAGFLHNQIEDDALVVGNIYENPELLSKEQGKE